MCSLLRALKDIFVSKVFLFAVMQSRVYVGFCRSPFLVLIRPNEDFLLVGRNVGVVLKILEQLSKNFYYESCICLCLAFLDHYQIRTSLSNVFARNSAGCVHRNTWAIHLCVFLVFAFCGHRCIRNILHFSTAKHKLSGMSDQSNTFILWSRIGCNLTSFGSYGRDKNLKTLIIITLGIL